MSDIANEVAQYLDDGGYGTLGTDIFVGQIPANINGIYVLRLGGSLNNYVPIEEAVVDIYVKNTSASTAVTTIESIKGYIHRMHSTETANKYIYTFLVIGDVDTISRDIEYAKIMKITVQVVNRDTSLIS